MQDLQDREGGDQELEREIAATEAKVAQVSRKDSVFPSREPTEEYTLAHYAALEV